MATPFDRSLARWRRLPTWGRRGGALAAALLLLWASAVAALNRPATLRRLRPTIVAALSRRLPGCEVGESLSVDAFFRVNFGPLTLRAERKGAPPVFRAERVKVRASLPSLLAGSAEPASVRLYGVRLEPGERFGELRALAERLRPASDAKRPAPPAPAAAPRDWPTVHLRGLVIALRAGRRAVEVGPLDLTLDRERDADSDRLRVTLSHRSGGHLDATLLRSGGGWRLGASLADLPPEALPSTLRDGAVRWSDGTVSGELSLDSPDGRSASGRVHARLDRADFSGDRLAAEPVGPVTVDFQSPIALDLASRRLDLAGADLQLLGAVDAKVDLELRLGPGLPFSLALRVPAIDFAALVAALPAGLHPPPEAPLPAGPLSLRFALSGPAAEPGAWTVDASLELAAMREAARRAPPVALRSPFTWRPEVEHGEPPAIRVGPENPDFVPLASLPEHVVRAVTTSEDAGFFGHPGFDFEELKNAFAQGAEAGRVVRGASTITQQLAKNLFLSREKTLVRKAREALVAVALEATVPKARLLEIYLNIAEWGPGLWGIGPAARHYFAKAAPELTVREAAFLASIIPNPVRYHGYFTRGSLDDAWNDRLRTILLHMAQAGVLSEAQLVDAVDAPLAFVRPEGTEGSGGLLPLAEPPLEALPADGEPPGEHDHQDDARDRPVEGEPLPK